MLKIPPKLLPGDLVKIVAPGKSLSFMGEVERHRAEARLHELGLRVSYGRHVMARDRFGSSSVSARVDDLHDAIRNPEVKAIIAVTGGFNSNQLLRHLDYDSFASNPKILCGMSDITALSVAFHARTSVITYSGPNFGHFGIDEGYDYFRHYFTRCLMDESPYSLTTNEAPGASGQARVLQEGEAEGVLVGGNLCTMNLLQGTEYFPDLEGAVLFIEDDHESKAENFDRDLQSLLHLPSAERIRGVVVGRFEPASCVSTDDLREIFRTKPELYGKPVVIDANFGHVSPFFTFPVGGTVKMTATYDQVDITVSRH